MELDPLQIGAELGIAAEFYPLGFPVRVETNSRAVLEAAEEAWGRSPRRFETGAIRLRVLVEAGEEEREPPLYRAQGHLITITAGRENFAVCDHTRSFAFCRLNTRAAQDRDFTRTNFLDAMALFTLTQLYVTPIHAAAVARGGRALLLAGASGAGKSTLAYACARRGWTLISDNETWLLRSDGRTVLGNPGRLRLRESALELFPELAGRAAVTWNGKRTVMVETAGLEVAWECRPERVVFLERAGDGTRCEAAAPEETAARLLADVILYTPEVRAAHRASLEMFAATPAVRLRYRGLEDGLAELERLSA